MARTVTTLCNQALSHVGIKARIADIDAADSDPNRLELKLFYDDVLEQTLQAHPWKFATVSVALQAVVGTPPPGWAYQYRYPSNCAIARLVTDAGGARWPTPFYYASGIYWPSVAIPQIPFDVRPEIDAGGNVVGRLIISDAVAPYLIYTAKVTDPNFFSGMFCSAFAWHLAMNIAPGLRVDKGIINNAVQMYATFLNLARAANLNEGQPDPTPDSPSIAARA